MKLVVEAPVRPSEDAGKVKTAIFNIFPDVQIKEDGEYLVGTGSTIGRFPEILKRYKIRDAARGVLVRGARGPVTRFRINKQAAYVGKVSFAENTSPLGDIRITIESDDLEALIDAIAPDTRPVATRLASEEKARSCGKKHRSLSKVNWDWKKEVAKAKDSEEE